MLRACLAGLLTMVISVLVGCSAAPTASAPAQPATTATGPTASNSPTSLAQATAPTISPGAASPAVSPAAPGPTDASAPSGAGRGGPGPYVLGLADAPVTIEEYADFQ
jgi:hypothetical protein